MAFRAIETHYGGYLFRSRLEARWAVFFDALGIEWQYEIQGFELSTGEMYLPDFHLPTFNAGLWCEVKYWGGDFSKALQFCKDSHERIWLCEGKPSHAIYFILAWDQWEKCLHNLAPWDSDCPHSPDCIKECDAKKKMQGVIMECGIPNLFAASNENRMYVQPCEFNCSTEYSAGCLNHTPYVSTSQPILVEESKWVSHQDWGNVHQAILAARQARFEHGQVGAPDDWKS